MGTQRTVVPDLASLKAMARAGLIRLHADTGQKVRHWTGRMVTAFYVDGTGSGDEPFVYKGRHYRLKYFDGCFSPFVVDMDFAKEIGVDLSANLIA
jgi:hypothetical protein